MSKRKKRKMSVIRSDVAKVTSETEGGLSYLKETGLPNLDEVEPSANTEKESTASTVNPAPLKSRDVHKEDFSAKTKLESTSALSIMDGYLNARVIYPPRHKPSAYSPSCLMMDYIVHHINTVLADNFYFKRAAPGYHPYILRLYFAVIFWIQCMRASFSVSMLEPKQHKFLINFFAAHSLDSLAIPGPLMPLFKTLCSSQPEFSNYGNVYPRLPTNPGPARRSSFIRQDVDAFFLPNVPGIFALLEHLNSEINSEDPRYPKKGKHVPVTETAVGATVFGHHSFPVLDERDAHESWSLVSPGLQYPCEADQRLNEAFAERYEDFDFPATAAGDDLRKYHRYFSMNKNSAWFIPVKDVAAIAASFFDESGTLADCAPTGLVANQITVQLIGPDEQLPVPSCSADKRSLFPFSFKLKTSARNLPPLAEAAAACAQTHIEMFDDHPQFPSFGAVSEGDGPFWDIRPIESGSTNRSSYQSILPIVRRMMKSKGPA